MRLPILLNVQNYRSDILSGVIKKEEIIKAIHGFNNEKACGIDNIPMEVLRNGNIIDFMCLVFNKCFSEGTIPSKWSKGIIHPIPKDKSMDPLVPMNYRGITLTCIMYKIYCSVLNHRLTQWAEQNDILAEEQNGFRPNCSCTDHLITLTTIINTRKITRK